MLPIFFILLFFISLIVNLGVIFAGKKWEVLLDRIDPDKPQKLHRVPVPRGGGIGVFLSFVLGLALFPDKYLYLYFMLSALPVFLIGLYEDFRGNIPPKIRMVFMAVGAVIALVLLDAVIKSVGFFDLPLVIGIPFTIFAVVGLTNAINMIDGFNGLSTGITLMALFFFMLVMNEVGDAQFFILTIFLMAGVLGFFVINFPWGKIFLGDGGAYFLGFFLAVFSVLMVNRNSEISPWFPVVLLSYPIFDVLFAIFRRKFIQGVSPFSPDKLHLHSLIYKKVTKNNPLTSVVILIFSFPFSLLGFIFYSETETLFLLFISFCLSYILFYYILSKNLIKRRMRG